MAVWSAKRKKPWPQFFLQAAALLAVMVISFNLFTVRYTLGYDGRDEKCLPYSLYLVDKKDRAVAPDDFVAFRSDERTEPWFRSGSVMIKAVRAAAGDRVEIVNDVLYINGQASGEIEPQVVEKMAEHRPEQVRLERKEILEPGRYWVMGELKKTFDSRYWGSISSEQVVGRAYPIF